MNQKNDKIEYGRCISNRPYSILFLKEKFGGL